MTPLLCYFVFNWVVFCAISWLVIKLSVVFQDSGKQTMVSVLFAFISIIFFLVGAGFFDSEEEKDKNSEENDSNNDNIEVTDEDETPRDS